MDFYAVLDAVLELLQRHKRVTYRALKRQFELDDAYLEDLKAEIIEARQLAVDQDGTILVWSGDLASPPPPAAAPVSVPSRAPLTYTPRHLAEKILTSRSALEGERTQVTVLFADVAGFTTLAEQLDPEVVHDIINRCFEHITAEVHRFEGTINQYTGDGVMALFGAPIAHEDSPRRTVHAALGIQRAIRDVAQTLQTERGLSLQMRIGINTGLVVVGKIGDDLRMDYTAVGDTTNLAARLQQTAQPGSIAISAMTHQHVAGFFETRDLGEIPMKGRASVRVFEVLRLRGRRTRFDVAVERGLTPLVGRERELATLRERFREVKAGQGQVVGIAGEAGMGKSRLVLEFRRALAQAGEGVTWLEGHCISFGQASPFLPLIEQLRENFQIDEFDGEPEIIAKVEQGMRRMGELEAYIPAIRYLLSVDPGDTALTAMDGAARRRQLFAALRALPIRGAQLRPLVLVVEDLHWIDTSSEEFLNTMLDAVAGVPLLLLMTYRIGYTPLFGSRSFYTTLTLHSFSEAEALAMAGHVLGMKQFPAGLQTALMEKAEGVPLFIEEVTKTLLDLGVLQRENGSYRLVKSLSEVSVPDTIQGIIMARLDRLGADSKRTVQLASVIGRQFLVRLLARVAGLSGRLDGLLRELQALEIIYEQGLLPEPAYIFKHAVIQDVAYNSLLLQRRKALHRAVGEAIEALYQDRLEEHYAELAHHFSQGEVWDKACLYWRQTGGMAFVRSALREALACFDQALAALHHLPESQGKCEQAIDLRLEMRNVLIALGDFGRMFDLLREAEVLAKTLEDQRRLGWVSAYLSPYFSNTGDQDHAIETGQRALDIATASGDFALEMMATFFLGLPYLWLGTYQQEAHYHRRNVEALQSQWLYERFSEPGLPYVFCRAYLDWSLAEMGAFVEGLARGEEAIQVAETVDQPFTLSHAYLGIGFVYLRKGDLQASIAVFEKSLRVCETGDIQLLLPLVAASLGYAYALSGRLAEALPLLERAVEQNAAMNLVNHHPLWMGYLGEAYLLVGRLEEAHQRAGDALHLSRDLKQRGHEAHALRLLGEIAAHRDPPEVEQAEASYRQALALADELGMRPLLAHCHFGLGILYNRIGRPEQARTELSAAIELYRAMEMTFWLERAEMARVQGREKGSDMPKIMKIAAIRETFVDEWVATEVLKVDKADVPLAGQVITHSPDKQEVYQVVQAYLARRPTARTFIFFTGEPIPEGVGVVLALR